MPYYPRAGKSKVTGTVRGTVRTVRDMRRVLASITLRRSRPMAPAPAHAEAPASALRRRHVVTADVYTGKHRREGALGDPGHPLKTPAYRPRHARPEQGRPPAAAQLVVIAKEPVPGRVKTRLTPPFTPVQAAALAEASLSDTLAAVAATTVARRVLALEANPGRWLPPGST